MAAWALSFFRQDAGVKHEGLRSAGRVPVKLRTRRFAEVGREIVVRGLPCGVKSAFARIALPACSCCIFHRSGAAGPLMEESQQDWEPRPSIRDIHFLVNGDCAVGTGGATNSSLVLSYRCGGSGCPPEDGEGIAGAPGGCGVGGCPATAHLRQD